VVDRCEAPFYKLQDHMLAFHDLDATLNTLFENWFFCKLLNSYKIGFLGIFYVKVIDYILTLSFAVISKVESKPNAFFT
jgi:hypothetical protein